MSSSIFMKKTFYHNFVPTKAEEEACRATNTPYQVTRVLVEIRDVYTPPVIDYQNPWQIRKRLTQSEVAMGKMVISQSDVFEHVFRYWDLYMANHVVLGHKRPTMVWDFIEDKRYGSEGTYLEILRNDDYAITCPELFKERRLGAEDEIGLYWDPHPRSLTFQFKLLQRAL